MTLFPVNIVILSSVLYSINKKLCIVYLRHFTECFNLTYEIVSLLTTTISIKSIVNLKITKKKPCLG